MLTIEGQKANFQPLMNFRNYRLLILLIAVLVLQSCYTLIYPPQTLPQSVTTVVSEPAMATSVGVSGGYGWDPYWEPALPFTSYHRGYGATYYSPYNYYDYHHPRYAPVYVVSEITPPSSARDFGRDEQQGGGRTRELNGSSDVSSSGTRGGTTGLGSTSASTAAPVRTPVIAPPVYSPPKKSRPVKSISTDPPKRTIKPVKITKPKPVKKSKEAEKKAPAPPKNKRSRTRK